ncbi:MAG: hypothetical protein K6B68_13715 [Eubacterium sp.]|nr:hypothetical protein [Eubacterium sp.]
MGFFDSMMDSYAEVRGNAAKNARKKIDEYERNINKAEARGANSAKVAEARKKLEENRRKLDNFDRKNRNLNNFIDKTKNNY